jgi:hypothetical protein
VNFSEYVFYFLIAFSIPILISVFNSFRRGKRMSAWKTLRVYLILVAIYATVLVATTIAMPIEVLSVHDTQYSGDWSIALGSMRRFPRGLDEYYELDLQMGNRGKKPIHGESNLIIYLLSENGTRYDALPEPSNPPFDAEVPPNKFVTTTRTFVLPLNQNRLEMVIAKQGFRLGWFLIGRSPFDGHTVTVIQ